MEKKIASIESGFTLIELVVGLIIIVVGVMGLSAAFVQTLNVEETNDQANLAINAARGKIELIKKMGYGTAKNTYASNNPDNCSFDVAGLDPVDGEEHPGKVTLSNVTSAFEDVTVDVKWASPTGEYAISSHARIRK